jgi:hypothetical protein
MLIGGFRLYGQGDVWNVMTWEAWACTWAWPRCNACMVYSASGMGNWGDIE